MREVEYNGRIHEFPDDATDAEIEAVLSSSAPQAPRVGSAPPRPRPPSRVDPMSRLSEAQRTQLLQRAAGRDMTRNIMPGLSTVTQPLVNMILDPDRRASVGRSMQGAWRDIQAIPHLDWGRVASDTVQAASEGVQNLPELGASIVSNLPAIARGVTYGPFEDEERAQRELDVARMLGDAQGVSTAADEANAQSAGAAANVVGFGAGSLVRTPLQAATLAGALDAPFALSRNADTATLQERLPDALTEIGATSAFGGTAQYGANRLTDALSRPPRTGDMVRRFEDAGVDPSLAAVNGGGVSGIITNAIGDNVAAGPFVRGRMRRQMTQASEASDRIAQGYGQPRPIEEAGRIIERGVDRFSRARDIPNPSPGIDPMRVSTRDWSFRSKAEVLYDQILEPMLDNPAALSRTSQVLDDIGRQADAPIVRQFQADPTLTAFERTVRRLQRGAGEGTGGGAPTLRDLRELRHKIRMAQDAPALSQSVDNAALQRLEAALTDDIYAAAGDSADNLRTVDAFYRRNRQRIDNVLSDFAQGEPGRAIPRILELAKPQGNTRSLVALRNALRPDEWRTVVASIIEYMGQPTAGASDFVARLGFSPSRFSTAYRAMSPAARRIIFGSRGGPGGALGAAARDLASELDNLALVENNLKGVEAMQNSSRSGSHISNLGTGAAAVANLPLTLSIIAGLGLLGEFMTNPRAVRWLTSAPRAGSARARGYRRWIAELSAIAARDPALYPVYNELAQSQAPESSPPERGFSDRPRSPQSVP